ncbi:hypothetical protein HK101_005108 [Irineochytrium annulatum]|nr:hypothetical protein HK101_005108 [Irineochytrium annulatum]
MPKKRDYRISILVRTADEKQHELDALRGGVSVGAMGEVSSVKKEVTIALDYHKRKILPIKGQRNILITSALPYCNNIPHLGNIIGCVLSADVYARFCRIRGYNTLYVCGTDEYGTATETKALEEKTTCRAVCDKYNALHADTYKWFNIDFDIFGRTSTEKQTVITQDIYKKLERNGKTEEQSVEQIYCLGHSSDLITTPVRFLADRFVEGVCPHCQYEDARGDQCDGCGKLLNATELIKPRCKVCGSSGDKLELRESKHIFLNLSDLQEPLESWINRASVEGQESCAVTAVFDTLLGKWSANSLSITKTWLKEGLKPRCITRDLKWGVPVPKDEFKDKVFYVWFDAPIGYLSITAEYTEEWEMWWKNPKNVTLYQFMGKDNVAFHTVLFPSSLIGTNEDWTLLHCVSTTEYLQYEGDKFSKSRGVGVFGNNVEDSQIPVDVWRYFLLSKRPESSDTQFLWRDFILANNSELLSNLGNFINRIIKFTNAKYDSVVPEYSLKGEAEVKLLAEVNALQTQYIDQLETLKSLRAGIKLVMDISSLGNVYLQSSRIDTRLFTEERDKCNTVVGVALNLVYLISSLLYPYLPTTAETIVKQLKCPTRRITDQWEGNDIRPGHRVGTAGHLFSRIEEAREEELRAKYSGNKPKEAAAAPEKKKKAGAKVVLLNEAPAGVVKTPKIVQLEKDVASRGADVRHLKSSGGSADQIAAAVALLTQAKEALTKEVGPLLPTANDAATEGFAAAKGKGKAEKAGAERAGGKKENAGAEMAEKAGGKKEKAAGPRPETPSPEKAATPATKGSPKRGNASSAKATILFSEVPAGVKKTPKMIKLEGDVAAKGDKVRLLRASNNANADELKKAVEAWTAARTLLTKECPPV